MSRAGTLYVVATPIGNLDDISIRAIRVLREAAVIAAEDTRTAAKLCDRHEIATPRVAFHEHSDPARVAALVDRLKAGQDVAVVSDAGTPGISDPGRALVEGAIAAGCAVVPIPGPVAFAAALSASGLSMQKVAFEGFLPARPKERRDHLATLTREQRTLAFYEAPHRIAECLTDLKDTLGALRKAVVAREISKIHEEFDRGTLTELAARWAKKEPRGEFTILVEGAAAPEEITEAITRAALEGALGRGLSPSAAAKEVAAALGAPRNKCYAWALEISGR